MSVLTVIILIPPFYDKDIGESGGVFEEVMATDVRITSIQTQEVQVVTGDVAREGVICDDGFTLIEAEWKGMTAKPVVIELDKDTTIDIKMPREPVNPYEPCFYGQLTDAEGNPQIGAILIRKELFVTDAEGFYRTDVLPPRERVTVQAVREEEFFVGASHGPYKDGWIPHNNTEIIGRKYIGGRPMKLNHTFKPWPKVTPKLGDIRPPRE